MIKFKTVFLVVFGIVFFWLTVDFIGYISDLKAEQKVQTVALNRISEQLEKLKIDHVFNFDAEVKPGATINVYERGGE